jgi:hypothetical protein
MSVLWLLRYVFPLFVRLFIPFELNNATLVSSATAINSRNGSPCGRPFHKFGAYVTIYVLRKGVQSVVCKLHRKRSVVQDCASGLQRARSKILLLEFGATRSEVGKLRFLYTRVKSLHVILNRGPRAAKGCISRDLVGQNYRI